MSSNKLIHCSMACGAAFFRRLGLLRAAYCPNTQRNKTSVECRIGIGPADDNDDDHHRNHHVDPGWPQMVISLGAVSGCKRFAVVAQMHLSSSFHAILEGVLKTQIGLCFLALGSRKR